MREFLMEQHKMCLTALSAFELYGDRNNLRDWFEGRRDMCLVALQKLDLMEGK